MLQLQGDCIFLPWTALFAEDWLLLCSPHFYGGGVSVSLQDSAFICSTEDWNQDLCLVISVSFPCSQ